MIIYNHDNRDGIRQRKIWETEKDKWRKEKNYQIKKKSERSEKGNLQVLENIKQVARKKKETWISWAEQEKYTKKKKIYYRNLFKWINPSAVPLVRYSGSFLKWKSEWLQQMDKKPNNDA